VLIIFHVRSTIGSQRTSACGLSADAGSFGAEPRFGAARTCGRS
jgi:hypothetical protein